MPDTAKMSPLSGVKVVWCDGAYAAEVQADMSDIAVEPTVTTYPVESGDAVDMHPVAVGYRVACKEGYTSDLLLTIDGDSEAGTVVVLDLTTGVNWVIPAHLSDGLTEGSRAALTPATLVLSELSFRQRRGQLAYAGIVAQRITDAVDTGAVAAPARTFAAVIVAGTVGGTQRAVGLHDLGATQVQGASSAIGYVVVASPVEVED